jgi:glycosyltransferase involved in cell wall biosynthesis
VHSFNTYLNRDLFYRTSLGSAFAVLTDSKRLSELASFRYGVDLDRFIAMPFAPSPFLSINHVLKKEDVLKKYNIKEGYFFYPAQLWPHKNHIRILEAVLLLKNLGRHVSVVFSGKDYGNQAYLERYVCDNCLNDQVKFLGFVPVEDMRGLYESTIAIVMPTYFGQTNLPPLEAWLMGKPLIYSSYYSEQSGDAALHIDPDNVNELAEAMIKCFDPIITHELIEAGYKRLKHIEEEYMNSEKKLLEKLNQYSVRRRCWK